MGLPRHLAMSHCKHCDQQTYFDKATENETHIWSWSIWCNQSRPHRDDTYAERKTA